jgi:hypothetical protein
MMPFFSIDEQIDLSGLLIARYARRLQRMRWTAFCGALLTAII